MDVRECVLCGRCLEVCPLLAATGREELGPRAKAFLAQRLIDAPRELAARSAAELAGFCLGCGRCVRVCPQGVNVPEIVAGLRAGHPDFKSWLWKVWLERADLLWPAAAGTARAWPESLRFGGTGLLLKMLDAGRAGERLTARLGISEFSGEYKGRRAALFSGCAGRNLCPQWDEAAQGLCRGLGLDMAEAGFGCCGSSLGAAGHAESLAEAARRNVRAWRDAERPMMVVYCASCLHGLRGYEPGIFDGESEYEQWLGALTPLSRCLKEGRFVLSKDAPGSMVYHRPCHVDETDFDHIFLQSALGPALGEEPSVKCCGFGGVMRLGAPQLCAEVAAKCWEAMPGVAEVLTGCTACALQLKAAAPEGIRAGHWLELFD